MRYVGLLRAVNLGATRKVPMAELRELMTDELEESGRIYIVGGGNVHSVMYYKNDGADFDQVPTLTDVAERWAAINDWTSAKPGKNPAS